MGLINWMRGLGDNTLYFPGCFAKFKLKEEIENYTDILNRLDIQFLMLSKDEVCCGMPAYEAGYNKDAKRLAEKNHNLFKKNSIKKIIAGCPSCAVMFRDFYPKLLRDWDIEVEHITKTILEGLKKKGVHFRGTDFDREKIVYQDPCYLGRYLENYNEPREIIERLGGKIIEFKENKEHALRCGGGGGVMENFLELTKKASMYRISKVPDKEARILVPSGKCYSNFSKVSNQVTEFSSYVLSKLKINGL